MSRKKKPIQQVQGKPIRKDVLIEVSEPMRVTIKAGGK